MTVEQTEVTQLLEAWSNGNSDALQQLMPRVFNELHRIASRYFRGEALDHTLQPTALVNEVYLKLVDQRTVSWQSRAHFFGVAARIIRRILVDYARKRGTAKRGGDVWKLPIDEAFDLPEGRTADLIGLDDALEALEKQSLRQREIVELRCFAGLQHQEIAEVMELSLGTVKREWGHARLWLKRELSGK